MTCPATTGSYDHGQENPGTCQKQARARPQPETERAGVTTLNDNDYDLTVREGLIARTVTTTDRQIPPRYRGAECASPGVTAWCDGYGQGSRSILLAGVVGSGKTYEAYGAIRRLASTRTWFDWAAITAPDLYAAMRPGSGDDPEGDFQHLATVPLLLLDDLGAAKESAWTEEIAYRLIGRRYDQALSMIITTNVKTDQIRQVLGDRIASRLAEMCSVVILDGPDRRRASR